MVKYLIVDPPRGWMYGFPRAILDKERYSANPEQWFRDNNYPQKLIDEGMLKYVRFWEEEINED